ncbi:unnamed protein product, partial [Porites evermanni]
MEIRVSCTLAIAIGIFTACWAPLIVVISGSINVKPLIRSNSPLGMWIGTLALSNSAMNFLIYSAKIQNFKEAYVSIIRKMFRFCSLPMAHGIALITVNAMVCILGSFGNLLLCFAIATHPLLRRTSNYLLLSLAIADLLVTLVCQPFLLEIFYNRTFFHECKASLEMPYRLIVNLSCSASVIHLASISLDRFIAVAFPLHYKIVMKKCGLVILLIASWALPISIPVLMVVLPPSFPKTFMAMASFSLSYFVI